MNEDTTTAQIPDFVAIAQQRRELENAYGVKSAALQADCRRELQALQAGCSHVLRDQSWAIGADCMACQQRVNSLEGVSRL